MNQSMMEYKDHNPGADPTVNEQVLKEIEAIGGDVKTLTNDVNRRLKEFQDKLDETEKTGADAVKAEELNKLRTEILEKAEALEKASTERLDSIETSLKRTPQSGPEIAQETKDAAQFNLDVLCAQGEVKDGKIRVIVSPDEFKAYRGVFGRYLRKDDRILTADELKALSVGTDPAGGYLVTPTISNRVVEIQRETSPIRAVATVETIGSDSYEYFTDMDEADAGWVGETEERSETDTPEVGKGKIEVHEMYAKPKATQRLLDDASIDVEAWLGRKIGNKFARASNSAFVKGNGIKKPRGFLTYPAGTAWGQIQQVATGAITGATYEGLNNIRFSLKEYYHNRAVWLACRQMVAAVMLVQDGDGRYIFAAANEKAGFPLSLLGYPIKMAADFPTPVTNALSMAFGDFSEGYTIVDRHGIRTLRDPFTKKPAVEFYTTMRVGGDVTNFEAIKLGKCAE